MIRAAASIGYALILAAVVIVAAGYFDSWADVIPQVGFIATPVAVPLLLASMLGRGRRVTTVLAGAIVTATWAYVVHVDTQPYQGGGASLAPVLGWMAGAAATTLVVAVWVALRLRALAATSRSRRSP